MKKLFLLGILSLAISFANAQEGLKGTWFVGGQLAFGSDKKHVDGVEHKLTNTTVLPILGTFITPSVAVGAGLGYMGDKTEVADADYSKGSNFVIKPLVRKYWNINGGLFFFGQLAAPVMFGNKKTYPEYQEMKSNTSSAYLELSPGFDYVINSWMTIETSFKIFSTGFSRVKPKNGDADTSFSFNANPFNSVGDRTVGELQVGVKFLF
ncbi:MAG: hypothetical protein E6772_04235 [Dysgonomonas sp.]|nr:hypothetical protein [Dysgonomonas sp.]